MNDAEKAALKVNITNSPKMASVWVMGVVGTAAAGLGKYFLNLNADEQAQAIAFVAQNHLWLVPVLTSLVGYYARVHPGWIGGRPTITPKAIEPSLAETKVADVDAPVIRVDPE